MERYPADVLWDEVTYLAYHLHWSLDDLLDLEHRRRTELLTRVAELDRRGRETRTDRRTTRPTG